MKSVVSLLMGAFGMLAFVVCANVDTKALAEAVTSALAVTYDGSKYGLEAATVQEAVDQLVVRTVTEGLTVRGDFCGQQYNEGTLIYNTRVSIVDGETDSNTDELGTIEMGSKAVLVTFEDDRIPLHASCIGRSSNGLIISKCQDTTGFLCTNCAAEIRVVDRSNLVIKYANVLDGFWVKSCPQE